MSLSLLRLVFSHQAALGDIHGTLQAEYQCRERMMVTRLDVTIASFHWSERAQVSKGRRRGEMSRTGRPALWKSLPSRKARCHGGPSLLIGRCLVELLSSPPPARSAQQP